MFSSSGLASFVRLCDVPCFSKMLGPDRAHQCERGAAHTLRSTASEEHPHASWELEGTWAVGTGDRLPGLDGASGICSPLCLQGPAPFQSVYHFFLFFFCRLKVEFYLLKPSASSLHLLQRAQTSPGPERLSEMLPSAPWEPLSLIKPSQRLDSLNSFLQTLSSAYRPAPPTRSKCWLTTF